jgi:hypothetical protein
MKARLRDNIFLTPRAIALLGPRSIPSWPSDLYHAAIFTLVNGGEARNVIAARFQALIAITVAEQQACQPLRRRRRQ